MALTEKQKQGLRDRGINPQSFDPRLVGDFTGFDFSGDFGQDLQSLNQMYQTEPTGPQFGQEDLAYNPNRPAERNRGEDYRRALDALFEQYPEQETFRKNDGGRNLYLDVGVPYFRQGDQTGDLGGQLGDFSTYHINTDSDALDSIFGLPPIQALAGVITGGALNPALGGLTGAVGGEFGGPGPLAGLELGQDILDYQGPGSTSGDDPRAPDVFDTIYDVALGDRPLDTPYDAGIPDRPEDLPVLEEPPILEEPLPGEDVTETELPPWLRPEPGDPDYQPPPQPPEPPPEEQQGGQEEETGGIYLPPIDFPTGGDETGGVDVNLPLPMPGGGTVPDITDVFDPSDVTTWDWGEIINQATGGTATGGSSNVNIDFGDLASAIAGLYAGYDETQQKPQFQNIDDLYGGEYVDRMKALRDTILSQDPSSMVADLTPDQITALEQMGGFGEGVGGDILRGQLGQSGLGLAGLGSGMGYANQLRQSGGPQFQYDQDVFDTTMRNLMPGVAGSYLDQTRDIVRGLNEQVLPGINMDAMATGNVAGSRAGLAEGIATRGAADRMGDIESQLMQNALNQGQKAAYGAGAENLGANLGTQGDIFGGYGSAAQYGLPGFQQAYKAGLGNIGLGMEAGNFQQQFNQLGLDAPRDLLGWQIPLMNLTTPAGAGNLGQPYYGSSPLAGMYEGLNMGTNIYDMFTNPYNPQGAT